MNAALAITELAKAKGSDDPKFIKTLIERALNALYDPPEMKLEVTYYQNKDVAHNGPRLVASLERGRFEDAVIDHMKTHTNGYITIEHV